MSSVAESAASQFLDTALQTFWLLAIFSIFGGDKGNETQLASNLLMVVFLVCYFLKN